MPFVEKKRILPLMLILALCLCLLCGCGKLSAAGAAPEPTPEPTPEVYAGEPEMDFTETSFEELCEQLPQLTALQTAHFAEDSLSPEQYRTLRALRPDVEMEYDFTVEGKAGSTSFTRLDLRTAGRAGIQTWLEWAEFMPALEEIDLGSGEAEDGRIPWETLAAFRAAHPEVRVACDMTLYGHPFTLETTELNLTHTKMEDQGALVKAVTACMPGLTYLDMDNCGVDDEHMAEIRDSLPQAEVVWRIWFGETGNGLYGYSVRTDVERILASNPGIGGELTPENTVSLKYCTKVKYLDVGHNSYLGSIEFCRYMPDLELVIVAMGNFYDLSPLENCTKLRYAELQTSSISDLRPLMKLKNLEDLNIAYCYALHDITPLYELPQLKRLYLGKLSPIPAEQVEHMRQIAPDCEINTEVLDPTSYGWRYLGEDEFGVNILAPSYAWVRDMLGYGNAPYCYAYPFNDPLYYDAPAAPYYLAGY